MSDHQRHDLYDYAATTPIGHVDRLSWPARAGIALVAMAAGAGVAFAVMAVTAGTTWRDLF